MLGSVGVASKATRGEMMDYLFTLTSEKEVEGVNNPFSITFDVADSSLDFNLIGHLPRMYNNRPNGMRVDLMAELEGLNPSFLGFPGGNKLAGEDPPYYLKWNEIIGLLKDRYRYPEAWTYDNTNELGLIEYLQSCDDSKIELGFYLEGPVISETDLQPYICHGDFGKSVELYQISTYDITVDITPDITLDIS
ncbi:hypothetical protein CC78DRAFT_580900 [Lojkania enalia]|uniref:Alpha-L-arabinofuranosidase 1 catalytic domain-containing protein n=1 Tax=Lojkania enalia TaxID=147567 RepID=A0A9P4KCJ0_9PLEO|nr:hypothetical protein CC78DRAFT_580900 [Didymosphaeria enalia]